MMVPGLFKLDGRILRYTSFAYGRRNVRCLEFYEFAWLNQFRLKGLIHKLFNAATIHSTWFLKTHDLDTFSKVEPRFPKFWVIIFSWAYQIIGSRIERL